MVTKVGADPQVRLGDDLHSTTSQLREAFMQEIKSQLEHNKFLKAEECIVLDPMARYLTKGLLKGEGLKSLTKSEAYVFG